MEGDQNGESDGNFSKGEEWAYKQEGETESSDDKIALGAATEDQHEPLAMNLDSEEKDDDDSKDKSKGEDESEEQHKSKSQVPNRTEKQNYIGPRDTSDKMDITEDDKAEGDEEMGEVEELQHQGRAAAERRENL